jgi:hypothetical protein
VNAPSREGLELAASRTRDRLLRDLNRLAKRKAELLDLKEEWRVAGKGWSGLSTVPLVLFIEGGMAATVGIVAQGIVSALAAKRHPLRRRARVALAVWKEPERILRRRGPPSIASAILRGVAVSVFEVAALAVIARFAGRVSRSSTRSPLVDTAPIAWPRPARSG